MADRSGRGAAGKRADTVTVRAGMNAGGVRAAWAAMPASVRALVLASVLSGLLGLTASSLDPFTAGQERLWLANLGWALAGVCALFGCLAAALQVGPGTAVRRAWLLYAVGSAFWIAGVIVRITWSGALLSAAPASCWLAFVLVGIASMASRLPRPYIFGIFLLDAVPVVLLLVAIVRVLQPLPADVSTENRLFLSLYPALYGLLAAHAIQMTGMHRDVRRTAPTVWIFTAGFCLMALAALLWVPDAVRTGTPQGHGTGLLWTSGLALLGAAGLSRALRPSGVVDLPPVEVQTGPHALPAGAAVLGQIILLAVILPQDRLLLEVFLLISAVDLFARLYLIRRDDQRLVAALVRSQARAESAAARERRSAQRLRVLADVTSRMKSLLLDELLQSVCDAARQLLGARYVAFGLTEVEGRTFTRFATAGLDESAQERMRNLPSLGEIMGSLLRLGAVRHQGEQGHPLAGLAPPGHPALEGFLGVPVMVSATERAGLYLAGKPGGFDEEDESLAKLLAVNAGHAMANAELYAESTAQREQLSAQNERLRELDRMKDEFIGLVSHELRTPLTSIVGYLELVAEEDVGPLTPQQRQFTAVMDRNTKRLLRLVDDLLFLSRIQSGELAMEPGEVDLAELAARAVEEARPAADRRGIALEVSAGPVPVLTGDRVRLAQLLDNLLSNAVKFTNGGGVVTVSTRAEDGAGVLEVSDTGMGIPRVDVEHVFERFYRAENAAWEAIPGSGLGLTITKAIVDAHGGSISVASEVGRGTTFRVRLPLRPAGAGEAAERTVPVSGSPG